MVRIKVWMDELGIGLRVVAARADLELHSSSVAKAEAALGQVRWMLAVL
jgi:hypothetical protein